jgi:hypothetical protein
MPTSQGPSQPRNDIGRRVRSDLWKAAWEASQVMSFDDIRDHVDSVIHEIEVDEP